MDIPKRKDIIPLGFLEEEEKFAAIREALFFAMPSQLESYSIVTLEAMKIGKPVLVNGRCDVLKGHVLKSNGGLWYMNYGEFNLAMDFLIENAEIRSQMGRNGKKYVEQNYTDDIIKKKLFAFLN